MPPTVALIPARGGSKGIPRKNLVDLGGKPLIAHTIEAAQSVGRIETVFVSSDDPEILSLAQRMGCRPLARPVALSADDSGAVEVVQHFLQSCLPDAGADTVVAYLQPTSPLRGSRHISEALALLDGSGGHGVMSVVPLERSPFKAFTVDADGTLRSIFDQKLSNANRQSLPQAYAPNGAIYAFTLAAFRQLGAFPSNGSRPYVMSPADSVDIDTLADLEAVRALMEQSRA